MARSDVWLGDLMLGIERLEIRDADTVRQVMQMLKLDHAIAADVTSIQGAWTPQAPARSARPEVSAQTQDTEERSAASPGRSTQLRSASLRELDRQSTQHPFPLWHTQVKALPRPSSAAPSAAAPRPLFPARTSRGLLSAALATWQGDGTPDVPRIVDTIANALPILEIPELLVPTLRRGAQVLIDTALAMAPFSADIDHVLAEIRRLAGETRIDVQRFAGCPLRGGLFVPGKSERDWKAPSRGTPIFLFTDLGIGGPRMSDERADPEEWLAFAKAARAASCPVVALVPYNPKRWPRTVIRQIETIHWDARTTAAAIRRNALRNRDTR